MANFLRRTKSVSNNCLYGRGLTLTNTRKNAANVRRLFSSSSCSFSFININGGGSATPAKPHQQDPITEKKNLLKNSQSLLSMSSVAYSKMATSGVTTPGEQKSVEVCRLMGPQDANISGNVHGGVILKMIEQAGLIVSTRHCNVMRTHESTSEDEFEQCVAGLVRVEKTDFVQPMYIGEVAQLHAEITHTAYHSMEVQVRVWAEDVMHGTKRMTNEATLWYVPTSVKTLGKVLPIPKISYLSAEEEAAGWERYNKQKEARRRQGLGSTVSFTMAEVEHLMDQDNCITEHSVPYAQSSLIHLAGVTDCNFASYVNGGVTMKLMDEVAGITAFKHCKTTVVTASMDAVNFHQPIPRGSVMHVVGRPSFTSKHSIEIEVFVDMETMFKGHSKKQRAVHAFFTFVSLSNNKEVLDIPHLKVQTEGEISRFKEGAARYELRKQARSKGKKQHQNAASCS
ncbi:cytosolic acyl coenzyme A thioester hydrolase-like isoform X1 [Asterias rubens]|uniref:cytosolic acyl coenzyme A thioester hydrolase-like isoform X1 n=2 Tax=Asterias rubens TaxID=7604 RepID=UPI0014557FE8|nr:cytosolic acyl coenzyme A thioester hydrolase-like isoform X1 [Asterias rubens]